MIPNGATVSKSGPLSYTTIRTPCRGRLPRPQAKMRGNFSRTRKRRNTESKKIKGNEIKGNQQNFAAAHQNEGKPLANKLSGDREPRKTNKKDICAERKFTAK